MKKYILLLLLLGSIVAEACPPPTGHLIVDINAIWNPIEFAKELDGQPSGTGVGGAIGYEIPHRWYSASVTGQWRYKSNWSVGLLQKFDFVPPYISTPIIPEFVINVGYDGRGVAYLRPGIEVNFGKNESYINFIVRYECGAIFNKQFSRFDHQVYAGLRFWIGKDW